MTDSHRGDRLPAVVDSYPVDESPYGVRGMAGNVKDWCLDEIDGKRVTRGGSWLSSERNIRLATRNSSSPTFRSDSFGIRLVCSL